MDFLSVLEIIVVAICAITYGFMLFFKVRGNVLGAVSELIALAEASGLTGAEKMSQVVNGLYVKIPAPLKKIFTPERLQSIAQTIFDWMRKYADEYKANSEAGVVKTPEEVKTDVAVAAADLAIELLKLTVPELKKKAEEYGIELDGRTRKDEILRAIRYARHAEGLRPLAGPDNCIADRLNTPISASAGMGVFLRFQEVSLRNGPSIPPNSPTSPSEPDTTNSNG